MQRVSKTADIRLTAVGDHLTAVRINGSPGIDWRRHYDRLTYTPVPVPPEITKGVRAYLDAFGLVFGAFDFGLDREGLWHWYECNPNGQWAWFPDHITAPITRAIADHLQHGAPYDQPRRPAPPTRRHRPHGRPGMALCPGNGAPRTLRR
ncbi:hypothetical protein [Streptomyces alanosinicus]|uniref:ATP-grasp ribosomal peptide maturase n=1 Tax=Streptomyces alanosinicus TaxID=68171 RepID=A0A918YT14_9ACTN|nr:hypothetical protein [Streptomyces alanosinicus]GHE14190.1 hypothetical protein GCM10010339_83940 [Streptomyces alanosinicus]